MTNGPTTGLGSMLCFDLYAASRALTAAYRPVLAEHDPAAVATADWLVEVGPGAGDEGGRVVASGPRTD